MATKNVVGHLVYKVTGDSKELDQNLKKSQKSTAKFTKFMKSVLGIGGAVIALRMLIRTGKDLVAAYGVQEQAENRLAAAIRATGGEVDELLGQYKTFASEIQQVTTVGDEQTLGLIQIGESLGIARGKMQEATRGAIGLSKAFGIDMNMAMRGIALAYEGNYTQLSRYIPALRTAGDEAERQAVLQEAMANGFEIAKAEAETGTGAMLQLQNAIGDLKEQGGAALTEFLTPSIKSLTAFVTRTTEAIAETRRLKKIAEELAEKKEVAVVDEIALLTHKIAEAERMYKGLGSAADEYAEFVGAGTGATEAEIKTMRRRLAALQEVARWEAVGAEEKRKMDAQALADEEARIKKQQELADWIGEVLKEYDKTEQGQRAILEAQIAKWEYELTKANVYKPQIQAILDMLYKQRDVNKEIVDGRSEYIDAINTEVEREREAIAERNRMNLAYQELRIKANEDANRKIAEDEAKLAEDKKVLEQAALDSFVAVWGELRSLNDQKASYEIAQLERRQAAELATFEGTEEEKKALTEQFEKEKAKLEYEAALKSWKLQLAGALAAFARSILEAAKNAWPIPALPMMALATFMGGIQLAAVRKAKPVPAFATGADFIVPPGYPNDSFPMQVESGEHVVVESRGGAGGEQIIHNIINLDGKKILEYITRASRYGEVFIDSRAVVKR